MIDRYFSESPLSGTSATLHGSEAHHLLHVMRAKPGTAVVVFDGQGGEWSAEVARMGRAEVQLALKQHHMIEREASVRITLAVPLPKGDRQRWLVEKAVELGVARLVPLTTERSQRSAAEAPAKLSRFVIEASKQCGRNRLMQIESPQSWPDTMNGSSSELRLLAHPSGLPLSRAEKDAVSSIRLALGPEGGFTEAEVSQGVEAGWQIVGLGERILRIETAAIALVSRWTLS